MGIYIPKYKKRGTVQNITTQGTTQQKQAFLVRKEMVRSEVRSEKPIFFG